jgi:hypothetical protein
MQHYTSVSQCYRYEVCYTGHVQGLEEEIVNIGQLEKYFLCVPVARVAYRSRSMGDSGRSKQR